METFNKSKDSVLYNNWDSGKIRMTYFSNIFDFDNCNQYDDIKSINSQIDVAVIMCIDQDIRKIAKFTYCLVSNIPSIDAIIGVIIGKKRKKEWYNETDL